MHEDHNVSRRARKDTLSAEDLGILLQFLVKVKRHNVSIISLVTGDYSSCLQMFTKRHVDVCINLHNAINELQTCVSAA